MTNSSFPDFRVFTEESLSEEDIALIQQYVKVGKPVDDLAYTDDFEALYDAIKGTTQWSKHYTFKRLLRLRKAGRLPRLSGG